MLRAAPAYASTGSLIMDGWYAAFSAPIVGITGTIWIVTGTLSLFRILHFNDCYYLKRTFWILKQTCLSVYAIQLKIKLSKKNKMNVTTDWLLLTNNEKYDMSNDLKVD